MKVILLLILVVIIAFFPLQSELEFEIVAPKNNTATTSAPPATTTAKKVEKKAVKKITSAPATSPAPTATSSPTPPASTPVADYRTQLEQYIIEKTNLERAKNNLLSLSGDSRLSNIARGHSKDMLENDYFSHEDLSGCDSSCRADNADYNWSAIGENIYMMSGFTLTAEEAAQKIVDGWMNSPGHRANILREIYTHSGVGVAIEGSAIYATAMYSKPR